MEYTINNELLTAEEKNVLKKQADDKLVDVLTALVDSSGRTFYGDMRINSLTQDIISIQDEISDKQEMLRGLNSLSYDELKQTAKDFQVKGYSKLNKVLLFDEVKKAIEGNIKDLSEKSNNSLNVYLKSYKNTFEYFVNDKISKLEGVHENNIDLSRKYRYLRRQFKVLSDNLKSIHTWIDALSNPVTLLNDYEEELNKLNETIKENERKFETGKNEKTNENLKSFELEELRKLIISDKEKKKELLNSIKSQREAIVNTFSESNIKVNFINMKVQFIQALENIKSNIDEAHKNGILDIDQTDIDKCIGFLNEYFHDMVSNEFAFRNFMDDNEMYLDMTNILSKENEDSLDRVHSAALSHGFVTHSIGKDDFVSDKKEDKVESLDEQKIISDEENIKSNDIVQERPWSVPEIFGKDATVEPIQKVDLPSVELGSDFVIPDQPAVLSDEPLSFTPNDVHIPSDDIPAPAIPLEPVEQPVETPTPKPIEPDENLVQPATTEEPKKSDYVPWFYNLNNNKTKQEDPVAEEPITVNPEEPVQKEDSVLTDTFVISPANAAPEEPKVSADEPIVSEEPDLTDTPVDAEPLTEDDRRKIKHTFKDVMIALCCNTKDRIVFKVREVKENTAEKISERKTKVKNKLIEGKDFVFGKVRAVYENDQKKYNEVKEKFNAGVRFITSKPGEIKQKIMDEYESNHGGKAR